MTDEEERARARQSYGCELWSSQDNREIHVFRRDGSEAGYTYILGFDPDMIEVAPVCDFLERVGHFGAAEAIRDRCRQERLERR